MKIAAPQLYIKPVPGKGRGVFAARDFKKGQLIELAPVISFTEDQGTILGCTNLANYTFGGLRDHELLALGYASLYNHSFKANAHWNNNNDVLFIFAATSIKKDEEITINYGWDNSHYRDVGIPVPKRKSKGAKK